MTSSLLSFAGAAEAAEGEHLPMSPIAYGLITFAFFLVLLGVLWSFRNTAPKLDPRDHDSESQH